MNVRFLAGPIAVVFCGLVSTVAQSPAVPQFPSQLSRSKFRPVFDATSGDDSIADLVGLPAGERGFAGA